MSWSDADAEKMRKGVAPEGTRILDLASVDPDNTLIIRAATYVEFHGLIDPRLYGEVKKALGRAVLQGNLEVGVTVVEVVDPTPPSPSIALSMLKLSTDEFVPAITQGSLIAYMLSLGMSEKGANTRADRFESAIRDHVYENHVWNRNRGLNLRGKACVDCMCPLQLVHAVTYPFLPGQLQPTYRIGIDPRSLIGMSLLSDEKIKEIMKNEGGSSYTIFGTKSIELLREIASVIERDLKASNV